MATVDRAIGEISTLKDCGRRRDHCQRLPRRDSLDRVKRRCYYRVASPEPVHGDNLVSVAKFPYMLRASSLYQDRRAAAINAVDDVIDQARSAFAAGVRQVWLARRRRAAGRRYGQGPFCSLR
jgi:hypothetical protein